MKLQEISKLKGDEFNKAISNLSLIELRELLSLLIDGSAEYECVLKKIDALSNTSTSNISKDLSQGIDDALSNSDSNSSKYSTGCKI